MYFAAVDEADVLKHVLGFLTDHPFVLHGAEHVDLESAIPPGERRRHDVLGNRQVGEYLRRLEDAGDAELIDLVGLFPRQHVTVEDDRSA